MIWATRAVMLLLAILGVIAIQLGVLHFLDRNQTPPQTLSVDPKALVRIFIEERGQYLDEAELRDAIRTFDRLVMEEAQALHTQTGALLINVTHVLAGGADISAPFAARVIARWDVRQ